MNKAELVQSIAEKTGLTKKDSTNVLDALLETIQGAVKGGDTVTLVGFGTFLPRQRAERNGVNPSTGESLHIPAKTVPVFRAGKKFKDIVNV